MIDINESVIEINELMVEINVSGSNQQIND